MFVARVLSAIVLIPIVGILVYVGGTALLIALALAAAVAAWEFSRLLEKGGFQPLMPLTVVLALCLVVSAGLYGGAAGWAIAALIALSLVWQLLRGGEQQPRLVGWALSFAGGFYVGLPLSFFMLVRELDQGALWVALVFVVTWTCDTMAYFVGRAVGRRRLLPHVSPGKTWEGTVGGVVAAGLVALLAVPFLNVPWWHAVPLGLGIGIAAVLGDLAESFIKRASKAKDASTLIPGHGGLLDRLDALLFSVVVVYYYTLLVF